MRRRARPARCNGLPGPLLRVALLAWALLLATPVRGQSLAAQRFIISVGSNAGLEREAPLDYAERDAERFASVMTELGSVNPAHVRIERSPSPERLLTTLREVDRELSPDTTLIVYYSGHGSVSALHTGGQALSVAGLRAAVDASRAGLRLLIIDACRDALGAKGFSPVPPFEISLRRDGAYRGLVVMHSAGPGERAFESRRLGAGVFSHHLMSGLRGAADRDADGQVSMDEAYDFAYGRTLEQSSAVPEGSRQHPSLSVTLQGAGPLVLTRIAASAARISLPPGRGVHYTVFERSSSAELTDFWSHPKRAVVIALPVGRFVVGRQNQGAYAATELTLPFGGTRQLTDADFVGTSAEALLSRGGPEAPHRDWVAASFGLAVDAEGRAGEVGTVTYARGTSSWRPSVGLLLARHTFETTRNSVRRDTFALTAGLGHRRPWGGAVLSGAFGGQLGILDQELVGRDGSARVTQQTLGGGPFLRLALSLPVGPLFAWQLELTEHALLFRSAEQLAGNAKWELEVATALTTGVGFSL